MVSMNLIKIRLNKMVYIQKGIEALKGLKYSIGAKFYCPVCDRYINHFLPFPEFYSLNAKKYDYRYNMDQAETLNYHSYSCPV